MVNVITEIIINKALKEVAEYSSNPSNAPEWYDNINSAEWLSEPNIRIGSKIKFNANFAGRQLSYTYEIKEFFPFEKMVMKTFEGPFPMETIYVWEAIDENTTRMILQNKGEPKGFSRLFSFLMVPMMRKANRKDLLKIKGILEKQ